MTMYLVHYNAIKPALIRQGRHDWPAPGTFITDDENNMFRIEGYTLSQPKVLVRKVTEHTPSHRWRSTAFGNGFPKAGTMLLGQILATIRHPGSTRVRGPGTTKGGWGNEYWPTSLVISRFRLMKPNRYMSGHIETTDRRVVSWLRKHEIPVVFVYRDLRDVVVSYTYHCEVDDNNKKKLHPNRAPYKALPSHEARLAAAITGIDQFMGIRDFWECYSDWLDIPWALKVKYEDIRMDPIGTCAKIAVHLGAAQGFTYDDKELEMLAECMAGGISPMVSPTFRAGRIGDWRTEFSPELLELFYRETDPWTERMGYER